MVPLSDGPLQNVSERDQLVDDNIYPSRASSIIRVQVFTMKKKDYKLNHYSWDQMTWEKTVECGKTESY